MKKSQSRPEKRLGDVPEVAAYVGTTPANLRKLICKNELPFPFLKVGRKVLFDLNEVDRWIDNLPRFGAVKADKAV